MTEEKAWAAAIDFCLEWEGGYANKAADRGKETNWGISKRAYPELDIKNLTREQAIEIYRRDYWERPGFAAIARAGFPLIAIAAFDAGVMSGPARGKKWAQMAAGTPADGIIGPKSMASFKAKGDYFTARESVVFRREHCLGIVRRDPTQKVFLPGWLRRCAAMEALLAKLAG